MGKPVVFCKDSKYAAIDRIFRQGYHIENLLFRKCGTMKNIENFLKAIGHEKRLRILKMLEKKNLCVCEITEILGIRQPTVSVHLGKLKRAGLIKEERNGLFSEYRIVHTHTLDIMWRLLSEKLEDIPEIKVDIQKIENINRYVILRKLQ
jgi:ArsR family transcriptional regulator